jgi:FkbM family methyltransferase
VTTSIKRLVHSMSGPVIGGRPLRTILGSVVQPRHYVALANVVRRFERPWDVLRRYVTRSGSYPWQSRVRTPVGIVEVTLYAPDDVRTLVEVFARLDYRAPEDLRVAVDVGANIGISTLYFLTRNDGTRCFAFEPDPRNVPRLRHNLGPFADRYALSESAIADRNGVFEFGVEPTGRYGGIGVALPNQILVEAIDVNDALAPVLAEHAEIQVLKVDTEGTERAIVAAIRPELAERLRVVYLEDPTLAEPLHPQLFRQSRRGWCVRLARTT